MGIVINRLGWMLLEVYRGCCISCWFLPCFVYPFTKKGEILKIHFRRSIATSCRQQCHVAVYIRCLYMPTSKTQLTSLSLRGGGAKKNSGGLWGWNPRPSKNGGDPRKSSNRFLNNYKCNYICTKTTSNLRCTACICTLQYLFSFFIGQINIFEISP